MVRPIERRLVDEFSKWEIIDCHEHLPPEKEYLRKPQDACTLFGHYVRTDLLTAGMAWPEYRRMVDVSLPLEERWGLLRAHLPNVRFGSYARAAFIAIRDFYGYDDVTDDNYLEISQAMRANLTPGIYERVLADKCRIRLALTCTSRTDYQDDPLMAPVMRCHPFSDVGTWDQIQTFAAELGMSATTLDDYVDVMEAAVVRGKSQGVVGLKAVSEPTVGEPNQAEAARVFERLREGGRLPEVPPGHSVWQGQTAPNALKDYLRDQAFRIAARHDLTVAVHAGVWGDFRALDSGHMIPDIMRNPETRFDLFHLGIPAVRQTVNIAKNFPNVWLNLCWTHIVSPAVTRSAMDEMLDMVPVSKVLAFGGDYEWLVEKVWGHLVMARESIASVLATRIEAGLMTEDQALEVAHKWFWSNPIECYRLEQLRQPHSPA